MRLATTAFLLASLCGCSTMSTQMRPDTYYSVSQADETQESLFAGDAAILSDEAIQAILAYRYEPPPSSRIALMPFGRETWSSWSEELALASESLKTEVVERLMAAPGVYDASYLPSILIPENRTVPHLREAAARYQADLLLVYRSFCRSFDKYRLFGTDESQAYCGVEAVLLDTRTGLVPFTSVATRSYDVERTAEDRNFQETRLRAQLDATTAALGAVSSEVVDFLSDSR